MPQRENRWRGLLPGNIEKCAPPYSIIIDTDDRKVWMDNRMTTETCNFASKLAVCGIIASRGAGKPDSLNRSNIVIQETDSSLSIRGLFVEIKILEIPSFVRSSSASVGYRCVLRRRYEYCPDRVLPQSTQAVSLL
ncbi:hypothetical protein J6590_026448 [Homalodisca vitripennis]|nr:hypothetical protein J6590_026448 [Homalodisca vitripennis]